MVLKTLNDEYHVRTFEDMQKDLENYLKEAFDEDGTWTVAEKKRKINEGCIAVVAHSTYPPIIKDFIISSGTALNPTHDMVLPANFLKPVRLFIDSFEYKELSLDDYVGRKTGLTNISEPTSTSLSAITRINFDRFYWWDEAKNSFRLNPPVTERVAVELYYIPAPNKLANDDDISTLIPSFTHLPPMWAAWRLLYKDEEYRARGLEAKIDYKDGLDDLERHRNRNPGNKVTTILMDRSVFTSPSDFDLGGRTDLGSSFDRIP